MVAVDLVPDRSLLNPNFDGYKLSLDSVPRRTVDLRSGVAATELRDWQFSLQHVKTFGCHNHLHGDPWDQNGVYILSKDWSVLRFVDTEERKLGNPEMVIQLHRPLTPKGNSEQYNAALSFASEHLLTIADGEGSIYLLDTGDRTKECDGQWKILFHARLLPDGSAFGLRDSIYRREGELQLVDVLLPCVRQNVSHGPFVVALEWITLAHDGTVTGWHVQRRRTLEGQNLEFATLDRDGKGIFIVSELPFSFTYDSISPIISPVAAVSNQDEEEKKRAPAYTWVQSQEDIMVQFTLPPGTQKDDIHVTIMPTALTVALSSGSVLLEGTLHDTVQADACTWTFCERRLEIFLCKCDAAWWAVVVSGDSRGEMVVDPEEAARIHDRLVHLTSDVLNPLPSKETDKPYNAQQLEECDVVDGDYCTLTRWDGEEHSVTHQANLGGHQWLFSVITDITKCASICLRHDVDGLLWDISTAAAITSVDASSCHPWKHKATFNAFGYVVASKQNRKFTSCAPDCSYVTVAENVRHVYTYYQPEQLATELRNRKTGRGVASVAKQRVAALESNDPILGLWATNKKVFVLTSTSLHVLLVN